MKNNPEPLRGFGRYDIGTSNIYRPTNIDEVKAVFAIARNSHGHKRVVIRAGGHSFDGQALHDCDSGTQLVLSTEAFQPDRIEFDRHGVNTVTLGSGVSWRDFVTESIKEARKNDAPIRIPGSMQTGGKATAGGTLSGDCLSRFSGIGGKESLWIESFCILTPEGDEPIYVSAESDRDLFYSVIGGHGYIGFVTEATYRLISIDNASCAHTEITTHRSLSDLIQKQIQLVSGAATVRAVSSAWFTDTVFAKEMLRTLSHPNAIKGAVFDSTYAKPADPKLPGFPLYHNIFSDDRYNIEVAARTPWVNWLIHEGLYRMLQVVNQFDDDLMEFLFFMDGDTAAREKFEQLNGRPFPIVQQTFVIPTAGTEGFTTASMDNIRRCGVEPTECDMLFVAQDECLMSASYHLEGFAVTFAFEPVGSDDGPPQDITALLRELSVDCLKAGGRIHLPKNSHVDRAVFRSMFQGQIERFEGIKRHYDPNLLLGNAFSDKFFEFSK